MSRGGGAACEGCAALLQVWADSLQGRCARCGHPFPAEFEELHQEALRARAAQEEQAARRDEQARPAWSRSQIAFLSEQVACARADNREMSRQELMTLLRSATGRGWLMCRDAVDAFLAEDAAHQQTTATAPADEGRLRHIVRTIGD